MGKVLSLNAKLIANEIIENIDLVEDILWEDYGRIEAGFRSSVLKILPYKNDREEFIDFLSIDVEDVPNEVLSTGQRTFRSITVDGEEIEFSGGFTDLHNRSYEEILKGNGFGLEENRTAINTVKHIRDTQPIGLTGDYHPFLNK